MLTNDSSIISAVSKTQVLKISNHLAHAEISLFGGQVLSYIPKHDGRERLWVSENAIFDGKKAIRGGIPICWPWFGEHGTNQEVSAHGYVRTQLWQIVTTQDSSTGTRLELQPQTSAGAGFAAQAQLTLVINIGQQLSIALHTANLGHQPFTYNGALHSYLAVSDIRRCELVGLWGQYVDKTRDQQRSNTPAPYVFFEETDSVHLIQAPTVNIVDTYNGPDDRYHTKIGFVGHDSIVVWNPWQQKSISMVDMADNSYQSMLCVESAITQGHQVAAGQTHVLQQVIS